MKIRTNIGGLRGHKAAVLGGASTSVFPTTRWSRSPVENLNSGIEIEAKRGKKNYPLKSKKEQRSRLNIGGLEGCKAATTGTSVFPITFRAQPRTEISNSTLKIREK